MDISPPNIIEDYGFYTNEGIASKFSVAQPYLTKNISME
jgi:hypothetical protein